MLCFHHLLSHSSALPRLSPLRHRHRHRYRRPSIPSPPPRSLVPAAAGRKAVVRASGLPPWLAELPEVATPPQGAEEGGPIELSPFSPSPLFAVDDNPSPLQVATSLLLTGSISVFLFRSLRRRAKRAKELRVRSAGLTKPKDLKEEALDSLKAMGVAPVEAGAPPSPVQALLGSIAAGVIAVILYKFATTVEASLNRQTISDNFSVRQITITVRTIVNGLCYLATFVFGINSVGLLLYSVQLAISSLTGSATSDSTTSGKEVDAQLNVVDPANVESKSNDMQESSDDG